MKENKIAIVAAIIFTIIGLLSISARLIFEEKKIIGVEKKAWKLLYDVEIYSMDPLAKLYIRVPSDTRHYRIVSESFSYKNLLVSFDTSQKKESRRIVGVQLSKNESSHFTAQIEIQRWPGKVKSARLTPEDRQYYLRAEEAVQTGSPEFNALRDKIVLSKSKNEQLIQALYQSIHKNIEVLSDHFAGDALSAIEKKQAGTLGKARALIALLRTAKTPARLVTGFILYSDQEIEPHHWVEVRYQKEWHAFDPTNGHEWTVPADYFPVSRNTAGIVTSSGDLEYVTGFDVALISARSIAVRNNQNLSQLFNLERLPIGMRNVVAIVLLLPLGVLVTAIFRNLIGLKTFGTFAPSLLALSFVMSDWRTGLVLLVIVLFVGYVGRWSMDEMKLLMVPRVGLILTTVIVLMTMAISLFDYLNLTPSANAVLLPTVIIAGLIERIFITEIEDGTRNVFKLAIGTTLVAVSCFIVFSSSTMRWAVISFPELLLIVVAILILLGRYSGYRLMELVRFKDLVR